MAFVLLEEARRFDTEEETRQAFRGDYRPTDSCCQPAEVP